MGPSSLSFCRRAITSKGSLTRWQRHVAIQSTSSRREGEKAKKEEGTLRELYPEGRILERGYHRVSRVHHLYYEVHGNPMGQPAVVLHGGPGAGCSAALGRLFDLTFWKVVLFDQRGCGKSVPRGLLHSNNPKNLVEDIENLRYHLKIKQWLVLGGSHGCTLALIYAQEHTSRVSALVLRAVCLMRKKELDWVFSPVGAAAKIPKGWQRFLSILQPNEQLDPIKAYYSRMHSNRDGVRKQAARYWREWTMTVMFSKLPQFDLDKITVRPETVFDTPVNMDRNINFFHNRSLDNVVEEIKPLPGSVVQSLIEAHFFYYNKRFMADVFPILDRIDWNRNVPCIAIHGEDDQLCLTSNALDLKGAWKEMDLRIVPKAGHSQFDPRIRDATIEAIDEMKRVVVQGKPDETFHDAKPEQTYQIPEPHYKKKYR